VGDDGAVALQDPDVVDPGAELVGNDLCQRCLESLAVRGDPEVAGHCSCRVEADRGRFRPGVDRHARCRRDARSDARKFSVSGDSDADEPSLCTGFRLLFPELRVFDGRARARQGFDEAGTVPNDPGGRYAVWARQEAGDLNRLESVTERKKLSANPADEQIRRPAQAGTQGARD
jgi:hypothetical protein